MAKVDTRSHKHFVWDASVSTVLHPLLDQAPQESFLQQEGRGNQRLNSSGGATSRDLSTSRRVFSELFISIESYRAVQTVRLKKKRGTDTSTRLLCGYKQRFSWSGQRGRDTEEGEDARSCPSRPVMIDSPQLYKYQVISKQHHSLIMLTDKSGSYLPACLSARFSIPLENDGAPPFFKCYRLIASFPRFWLFFPPSAVLISSV